ncbi:MAG: DUF4097 family beta strand repeat-containing protein [Chloroflexi bacterium]|nr:DUF4097 family beta strand repeat-containing protein [Chloroflexota bacterium]MCL5275659.1 DUF4097 family beta strand repeat-containing protein [Chloroflexota bacterium]
MEQENIERRFEVTRPASLTLANISGSVDIQTGDDGVITVTAVKSQNGDAEHTRIEMNQNSAGAVSVITEYGESFWRFFGQHPSDVAYTMRVPRDCSLQLKCVSSHGQVKGLNGKLDLSGVSGDLALEGLSGAIKVNMVSGNLSASQLTGTAEIETVSGQVDLHACNFESLRLSTVSGRVTLETPLGAGPYKLHSVSGNVQLALPSNAKATVEFSSLSGRLATNLPTTHSQQSGSHRHVELQGGGPAILFESISGDLQLTSAQAVMSTPVAKPVAAAPTVKETFSAPAESVMAPPSPAPVAASEPGVPPAPDPAIEEAATMRRNILDRVAHGEITVDEAVNLLRG